MCAGDWEPRAAAYCLLLGELANRSAAIMLTDLLREHPQKAEHLYHALDRSIDILMTAAAAVHIFDTETGAMYLDAAMEVQLLHFGDRLCSLIESCLSISSVAQDLSLSVDLTKAVGLRPGHTGFLQSMRAAPRGVSCKRTAYTFGFCCKRTAYTVVAMLDVEWIIEAKVLRENFGAVDIWIPKYCLLIMVDGEGHFNKMYNLPSLAQEQRDDRFHAEACRLGFHVLRLHHVDQFDFKSVVPRTVQWIKSGHLSRPTLMYSGFYQQMYEARRKHLACSDNLAS